MKNVFASLPKPVGIDQTLLAVAVTLLLFGFVMMFSSSLHLNAQPNGGALHYPSRQIIFIAVGIFVGSCACFVPMDYWFKAGPWLFIVGVILLIVVLHPDLGVEVKGSRRWLQLFGIRVQVSEIIKLVTVIYVAGYVVRHQHVVQASTYGFIRPLLLIAVACGLLLKEPDYGSAVVILTIALGMMFLGGAKIKQFMILMVLTVFLASVLLISEEYRMKRIMSFINPWIDANDSSYQLVQALISFGLGETFGVGIGNGVQKLFYLPEGHTDFLFSIIGEELGLAGVLVVIALYTLLIWRAFQIGAKAELAEQPFSAYIAYGLGIWIGFQSFVNMGVNMGVLPTKGLTLPLMSYGGGSMIIMCIAIALLLRVHLEASEQLRETNQRRSTWASAS